MKQDKMGSVQESNPANAKVTLRVGPRLFETEKRILKAYPDSMLAKMFSDNTETSAMVHPDEDGAYILQVAPAPFEYVLKFLETGVQRSATGMGVVHRLCSKQ
jgi:hypothetical protein